MPVFYLGSLVFAAGRRALGALFLVFPAVFFLGAFFLAVFFLAAGLRVFFFLAALRLARALATPPFPAVEAFFLVLFALLVALAMGYLVGVASNEDQL